jgi:hypothetical protein
MSIKFLKIQTVGLSLYFYLECNLSSEVEGKLKKVIFIAITYESMKTQR